MSNLKFTSVENTPEMVQAKVSNKLAVDVSSEFATTMNNSGVFVSAGNIRVFTYC